MNLEDKKEQKPRDHRHNVHHVLAHSYIFYFLLFLIGITLDFIYPIKIFNNQIIILIGFAFLIFASFLIFWAQKTSRDLGKLGEIKTEHFCRGPYCYTRSPTHWGLFLLTLGFSLVVNAAFVVLATLISLIASKFVFLKREESILAEKYGVPYLEYKKLVRF